MAVLIDYGTVLPIGPKDKPGACIFCSNEYARWIVKLHDDRELWCARCFLYETEWGKTNGDKLHGLVSAVEINIGKKLTDDNGKLIQDESDRILSSVVLLAAYRLGKSRG